MPDRQQQIREELASLDTRRRRLRKELRGYKAERIGTIIRKGRGSRDRYEELKAQRGYTNPSSYVRRDGSEVLKGEDWKRRKCDLAERSEWRCEYEEPMPDQPRIILRCARRATIPAHVIPRHPKRDDRMENLKHYCKEHDRLTEKQGWRRTRFGERRTQP